MRGGDGDEKRRIELFKKMSPSAVILYTVELV